MDPIKINTFWQTKHGFDTFMVVSANQHVVQLTRIMKSPLCEQVDMLIESLAETFANADKAIPKIVDALNEMYPDWHYYKKGLLDLTPEQVLYSFTLLEADNEQDALDEVMTNEFIHADKERMAFNEENKDHRV